MRRLACLLALIFLTALPAAAQTALVRGVVTDAETRAPLQGATVTLLDGDTFVTGAATDADGAFALRRVPAGTFTLRARFLGYTDVEQTVTLADGESQDLRIELAEDTATLSGVVVAAQRPGGLAGSSAGAERITGADLAQVPVPGVSGDLASYVQVSPAVTAVGDRGGQFYVRGGEPSQTLVRVDGLRLYRPFHVLGFYSAVPSDIIDDATLHSGAYPARFGGRLSSVLDVRTRAGSKNAPAASVALAPALSAVYAQAPLVPGRVSAVVSARESLVDRVFDNWFGQDFPYTFGDVFGKVDARFGSVSLAATGMRTHDAGNVAGSFETFQGGSVPEMGDPPDSLRVGWTETAGGLNAEWASRRLPVSVSAFGSVHRSESTFGAEAPTVEPGALFATPRGSRIDGVEGALTVQADVGPAALRVGGTVYDADVAYRFDDRFAGLSAQSVPYTEAAGFAELDLGLPAGLVATGGLRVERYAPADKTVLSPSARLAWTGTGLIQEAVVGGGIYYQGLVGVQDQRDVGDVFTAFVPVGPDEELPEARHLVASVRGGVPGLRLAVEGFYKTFPNLLVSRFTPLPGLTANLDAASGEAKGVDLRLEASRALAEDLVLSLRGGYALSFVDYETAPAGGGPGVRYSPTHDQRHSGSAVLRLAFGDYAVSATGQAGSGFAYTPSAGFDNYIPLSDADVDLEASPGQTRILYGERGSRRLPAYARLDIWGERVVSRGRSTITLRAGVVNVLNRDNIFYFDLLTLRRANQLPFFPSVGVRVDVR